MLFSTVISAAALLVATVSAKRLPAFIHPVQSQNGTSVVPGPEASDPITYVIGNPVLTGDVNIYYVYYGDFSTKQKSILEGFANSVQSSGWYSVTRQYYYQPSARGKKTYVNGAVKLGGTTVDNYSKGKSLSGNALPEIIQAQIDAGKLPEDENGVYFVLTAGDVKERIRSDLGYAEFCSDYCGYHVSWVLKSGKRIFYSQVGNARACLSGCAAQQNQRASPNDDPEADAMISVLAHELTEAISDPWSDVDEKRAWQDSTGYENADKCAWTYGKTARASGGIYNLEFGGRKWLIQQNWSPVSQSCALNA